MIKVLFFAQIKEVLDTATLTVDASVTTVEQLRRLLCARGELWAEYLASGKALVAVNQTISDDTYQLSDNDEVAFFPPVTGG